MFTERLTVPDPCVEVKNAACFDGKVRVTRKDPRSMLPRLERVSA